MRQELLSLVVVFTIISCANIKNNLSIEEVFNNRFEHKMISSGPNFPDFNSKQDSLDLFLVALHEQILELDFQSKVGWSDEQLRTNTQILLEKNWLINNQGLKPTIFIATAGQGKGLFDYAAPLALEISRSIEEEFNSIKTMYNSTTLSKAYDFEELSFFILSNVLLDNWQINNIEREFLQTSERPERHKKHYYYAIMENTMYPKEGFGIYGNQYNSINDSTTIAVYGNNRNDALRKIKDKTYLAGLLQAAPYISKEDNVILERMANYYKPKIIQILAKNSDYILNVYDKSGYSNEITFDEFFIWWYHFIYTEATNMLAENNLLKIPDSGNFFYKMK